MTCYLRASFQRSNSKESAAINYAWMSCFALQVVKLFHLYTGLTCTSLFFLQMFTSCRLYRDNFFHYTNTIHWITNTIISKKCEEMHISPAVCRSRGWGTRDTCPFLLSTRNTWTTSQLSRRPRRKMRSNQFLFIRVSRMHAEIKARQIMFRSRRKIRSRKKKRKQIVSLSDSYIQFKLASESHVAESHTTAFLKTFKTMGLAMFVLWLH